MAEAEARAALQLSASLRRVAAQLRASKTDAPPSPALLDSLSSEGALLLMQLREAEASLLAAAARPSLALLQRRAAAEQAEGARAALAYERARARAGLAAARGVRSGGGGGEGHRAALAALAAEGGARRRAGDELAEARARRRVRAREAAAAKGLLCRVDAQLESLVGAAATLEAQLAAARRREAEAEGAAEPALVRALPPPLFTLWTAVSSYLRAWGAAADVAVAGDAEAARLAGMAGGEAQAEALCKPYPLEVTLSLRGGTVTLHFLLYVQLGVVVVRTQPASASAALSTLFPQDDGCSLPDQRCHLRLASAASDGAPVDEAACLERLLPGRPYAWAQWLGGLGPVLQKGSCAAPPNCQEVMDRLLAL
ncbi:hypothetical protein AB1Y20_013498 [Prymnesium parvum]|uniref:Uncharacterized protein n=1 Tax=Prymnesium parvum TaxID=97485 RepID=A0AB34IF98_PRYPA